MSDKDSIFQLLKPGIPKRYLLLVVGTMWLFASGMLFYRGFSMMILISRFLWLRIGISVIGGILFDFMLFLKISRKHIKRILKMDTERPCLFSFFNIRSYLMMALMIGMGVALRKTGIVPLEYLSVLYVSMGFPLFMSAFRFYLHGIYYKKVSQKYLMNNNYNNFLI